MHATGIQINLDDAGDLDFVYDLLSVCVDDDYIDVINCVDIRLPCKHLHKRPWHHQQGRLSKAVLA